MWNFGSQYPSSQARLVDAALDEHDVKGVSDDERFGLYSVIEASGYQDPASDEGADFKLTAGLWGDVWCWTSWFPGLPPKTIDAERAYIVARRQALCEGAKKDINVRFALAARVNRPLVQLVKFNAGSEVPILWTFPFGTPLEIGAVRRFDLFRLT